MDIIGKTVIVDSFQTTYINLAVNGKIIRFDFINKKEFKLKAKNQGVFTLHETHPLLLDYNEQWVSAYVNSKASDVERLIFDIHSAIDGITDGWRNWTTYITNTDINFNLENFQRNLKEGNGKLFEAPLSIANAIMKTCESHNILTKSFEMEILPEANKLMMIGNDYVIAKDFKIHE